jgi:hypothetical protein
MKGAYDLERNANQWKWPRYSLRSGDPGLACALNAILHWSPLKQLTAFAEARHGYGDSDAGCGVNYPGDFDDFDREQERIDIPDGTVAVYQHWGGSDGAEYLLSEEQYLHLLASVLWADGFEEDALKVLRMRKKLPSIPLAQRPRNPVSRTDATALDRGEVMLLHIVKIRDPNHLVAKVKLKHQKVSLDVLDQTYEKYLRELFSKPFFRFTVGGQTHEGVCIDAGETIQPWDPRIIELLPEKLCSVGLKDLVINRGIEKSRVLKIGKWLLVIGALIPVVIALIFILLVALSSVAQLLHQQ